MHLIKVLLVVAIMSCSVVFAQGPPPAKVVVAKITKEEVSENSSFLGLLYYDRVSLVSSSVPGLVDKVTIRQGDRVKKGDPLVYLSTEILDKEIELHKTRIDQIELRIQHAEKNYKRLERLYSEQGISEKDYDDALHAFQDYGKDKKIEEAELYKLLIQKRKSITNAPFDGVILEKTVSVGEWVQPGGQLVRMGSTKDLFARVPVAETTLQFVTVGEKVLVVIHAYNREITGTIADIVPVADEKTKNVFLKVRIPSMTDVAENMSASVYIPVSKKRRLAIIKRDALIKFQGKDFVYSITDDKASILPVNVVTFLGDKVAVDNPNFEEGMPVVVEGNERLQPGQAVVVAGEL